MFIKIKLSGYVKKKEYNKIFLIKAILRFRIMVEVFFLRLTVEFKTIQDS